MTSQDGRIARSINVISNSRICIPAEICTFCYTDNLRGAPHHFRTTWSLIWHLCHYHKDEVGFEHELKRLKQLAIENSDINKLEDIKIGK
ncbi:MAG: hypothetical protein HY223_00185 [Thaumarchaeota archaeon]|nr:hypothetical protein [Nitrososphaerota archaeon]